jgi:hypothetical protein
VRGLGWWLATLSKSKWNRDTRYPKREKEEETKKKKEQALFNTFVFFRGAPPFRGVEELAHNETVLDGVGERKGALEEIQANKDWRSRA